jgi:hypothetical protein
MTSTLSRTAAPTPEPAKVATAGFDASPAMRWILAALSFAAGVIHLVMVPQHAEEALRVGIGFAVVGWFQIAFGVAVVVRATRTWIRVGILANVVFVAIWFLSRTMGLPDWTGDGAVEKTASVDALCVAFEIAIIVGAVALLLNPKLFARWTRPAIAVGVVIAAIVTATTAVLASPSTAEHAHNHGDTSAAGTAAHVHDHSEIASSSSSASGHQHSESTIAYDQLPPATKAQVDDVIATWGHRYATAADAMKDGWFKATRSLYGIGAHYVRSNILNASTPFDPMRPNILLFDGEGPDAKFAGVSYLVAGTAPKGFVGPYDSWHTHQSVCVKGGTIVSLNEPGSPVWYSEPECVAAGGAVLPLASDEMLHVWIGPDYIKGAPIFAHDHPKLYNGYDPKRDG